MGSASSIGRVILPLAFLAILAQSGLSQPETGPAHGDTLAPKSTDSLPVDKLTKLQEQQLLAYVRENHRDAVPFVLSQFQEHDVVLLGEVHQITEHCQFVASLVEPLHAAGVHILFTEFTRSSDNAKLNQLITAPTFQKELALQLFRGGAWPTWGFQEYVDILRAAWSLNQKLPAGAAKFRVVGIDNDWSQHELWFGGLSRMQIFQHRLDREKHMIQIIRDMCLKQKSKALVHIGRDHTNTKQGIRLGKVLTDEYGNRIKQVVFHHTWPSTTGQAPITGILEHLALEGGGGKAIGFEITETPLNGLTDSSVVYWRAIPGGTLGDFAQSYILLVPLDKLHRVTWIPGFITDDTYQQALAIAVRARWVKADQTTTPAELDQAMQARFSGQLAK